MRNFLDKEDCVAQADLSRRRAHISGGTFSYDLAQFCNHKNADDKISKHENK